MDKKYIILGIVVIIALIGVGVFAFGNTSQEHADNELVMAVSVHGGEPEGGFDPLTGWATGTEPLIQSTLFKKDSNGSLINDLATDYSVSSDLKTIDVDIRDDVKFTDGNQLTAKDVAFTYNTAKETGASADLSSMDNATATNDTHVQFTLNKEDSTFINKLTAVGIVPADTYNNETYGENPVGSGPYKLTQWDKGQQAIFEINEDYYGKKPYYEKITNLFMEPDAAVAAAQKGEIDVVEAPLSYSNQTIEGMHQVVYPSVDVRGIALPVVNNTGETTEGGSAIGNNVTSDPAIREALQYGLNRSQIVEGAFNGLGNASMSGVGNQLPWAPNETINDGDVEKAKQTLASAGWTDTDGDGIVEKDGQKASFELDYSSSDSTRQAVALQVAEQAKELGIEITPEGKTWDEMDQTRDSTPIVWGFGSLDPYTIYTQYYSEEAGNEYNNPAMYNNSAVDSAISSAMSQDLNASYSSWSQVPTLAQSDSPWIWIGSLDYLLFVSDSVDLSDDTHTIYPHGGDIWGNVYDWKHIDTNETS